MEPSRVYGYISLVDPSTGQVYLPRNITTGDLMGYPLNVRFVFHSTAGEPFSISFPQGQFLRRMQFGSTWALLYDVQFIQDVQAQSPPGLGVTIDGSTIISYNPDLHQFDRVEADPYIYADPAGTPLPDYGWNGFTIPLEPRSEPFPQFPNPV